MKRLKPSLACRAIPERQQQNKTRMQLDAVLAFAWKAAEPPEPRTACVTLEGMSCTCVVCASHKGRIQLTDMLKTVGNS